MFCSRTCVCMMGGSVVTDSALYFKGRRFESRSGQNLWRIFSTTLGVFTPILMFFCGCLFSEFYSSELRIEKYQFYFFWCVCLFLWHGLRSSLRYRFDLREFKMYVIIFYILPILYFFNSFFSMCVDCDLKKIKTKKLLLRLEQTKFIKGNKYSWV